MGPARRRPFPLPALLLAVAALAAPRPLAAQTPAAPPPPAPPSPPPPPAAPAASPALPPVEATAAAQAEEAPAIEDEPQEETSPAPAVAPLVITGYVDVGYAKAQGDGTSFPAGDMRVPADYGVDPFAPAINSRGEVASTDAGGRFVNGFLPRSAGIGGTGSLLINTVNVDLRYTSHQAPVMVFSRVQLLPRFETTGESTRLFVEQAFGRVTPWKSAELALSVGKFDSVFGIEYLDNQANFRVGVTPSLMARYTTGQSIGVKVFYRYQFASSLAVSLNAAGTNSGTFVEALQGPDRSLTGVPVGSARLGLEQNLPRLSIKVGASGVYGPRNDQLDRDSIQRLWGLDARVFFAGLSLAGEYVDVHEDEGSADLKQTGLGTFSFGSEFQAHGFWTQLAYELPGIPAPLRIIPYGRYEQRHASFQGFIPVFVDRFTFGLHVDLWDNVQVKGEVLINRELAGAPSVPNNVYTSSVVWTW
jgi:hypothetical protein